MAEVAVLATIGRVVSHIIIKLVNKAYSCMGAEINQKLKDLETTTLPKIHFVIEAAEMTQIHQLGLWLRELKAATHEAEDLLDEHEYYLLEEKVKSKEANQVSGLSSSALSVTKYLRKMGRVTQKTLVPITPKTRLMKSLAKLEKIAARVDEFVNLLKLHNDLTNNSNFCTSSAARKNEMMTPCPTVSSSSVIFGRDAERDSLMKLLISVDEEPESSSSNWKVPIFVICGIGGAGKTALAQYIFNDRRTKDNFDMRMWVQVSRDFDVSRVTRKMIESATDGECPRIENLDTLQKHLKKILLSSWKFLLVLDDVWCSDWNSMEQWEQLLAPLNEIGARGCRILVTTRMERAASVLGVKDIVCLKDLEPEDCWSIIKHYAFGDSRATVAQELVGIGKQIVDEVKGLPLAAKMVGRQLKNNFDANAWRIILKGDMLKKTMSILLWSFKLLPAHLKPCFAFCSVFPKGREFICNDLVHFWMAQGFIESLDGNELSTEEMGREYFNDLLSYSFFQHHPTYSDCYVIHDLLHDLAERISKDDCFRIEGDEPVAVQATVLHLSINTRNLAMHMHSIGAIRNLRTLMILDAHLVYHKIAVSVMIELFLKLRKLRVLCLGFCHIDNLPSSIGCLKHLRYLDLSFSGMEELPKSLCKLYHLQVLKIMGCQLDIAPKGFSSMISLRHLYADSGTIPVIPDIGRLTSLRTLGEYHVQKKQGYEIAQLKNLSQLQGELSIMHLENVKDFSRASEAMIKDKTQLESLTLCWGSSERDAEHDEDLQVLEGLEPPLSIKVLSIICYKGVRLANWMLESRHLHALAIENCTALVEMPPLNCTLRKLMISSCPKLAGLPSLPHNLSELRISSCPELMQLSPFPQSLDVLNIKDCPGIETLMSNLSCDERNVVVSSSLKELDVDNSAVPQVIFFRCLKNFIYLSKLKLFKCQWLTSLLLDQLRSLQELYVYDCQNLISLRGLEALLHLQLLRVSHCRVLTTFMLLNEGDSALLPLPLQNLEIYSCDGLEGSELTRYLLRLRFLTNLTIMGSSHLRSVDLSCLRALQYLSISRCPELTSLGCLQSILSLRTLRIFHCSKLAECGRREGCLSSIKHISTDELLLLPVVVQDDGLNSLQNLEITLCSQDSAFSSEQEEILQHLTHLTNLTFFDCMNLPSLLLNLDKLSSLKELEIKKCPKIDSLPDLPASLEQLRICQCDPNLALSAKSTVLSSTRLITD